MTRLKLACLHGSRLSGLTATVGPYGDGMQGGVYVKAVALQDIRNANGELLADHCWVGIPGPLDCLGIGRGDRISFTATVERYHRGRPNHQGKADYKLAGLSDIRLV